MSIFNNNLLAGAAAQGGTTPVHTIDQSIRFNDDDSPYMLRTPSSAGDSRRKYSISVWFKIGEVGDGSSNTERNIFMVGAYGNDDGITLDENDKIKFSLNGTSSANLISTQKLRDHSAWYHVMVAVDTTQTISTERIRMFLNGSRITDFATENYPTQNYDGNIINNVQHNIGARTGPNRHFDGYLAEIVLLDNTVADPSSFGEYNSSNIWIPIDVSGLTFGTNGFYLKGDDANNLGKDSSGNDNDFANSLHTFEPSESNGSLSNGNLTTSFASVTNFRGGRGFVGKSSGKWYAEVTIDNRGASGGSGRSSVGITRAASFGSDTSTNAARDSVGAFTYSREGAKEQGTGSGVTSTSTGYASFSNGDVIGVALNMDDGEVYFYKNGTAQDSGTAAFTGLGSNTYDLIAIGFGGFQSTVNFGATAFSYTPPTGYAAWDTGSSALLPSDQVPDSPTNNFAVLNPLNLNLTYPAQLSEGNLKMGIISGGFRPATSTIAMNSGKFYAEAISHDTHQNVSFGFRYADVPPNAVVAGQNTGQFGMLLTGQIYDENTLIGTASGVSISGTQRVAIDLDAGKGWLGVDSDFFDSSAGTTGNPSTGANPTFTFTAGRDIYFLFVSYTNLGAATANFGQDGTFAGDVTAGGNTDANGIGNFKESVPTGYLALCTKNLGS